MKTWLVCCFATLAWTAARAQQPSLSSQIDSVYAVQQQQEQAAAAERQAAADAEAREEYKARQERALAAAEQRRRESAVEATEQAKEAEARADKDRDQKFEDQERQLQLQQQQLVLAAEKARVARENDYINRDLAKQDAETDVIKSQADATRSVSSGEKTLLEDDGTAAVKKQSGLFN